MAVHSDCWVKDDLIGGPRTYPFPLREALEGHPFAAAVFGGIVTKESEPLRYSRETPLRATLLWA